ncbi:MAG: hypothetical protein JW919_01885 [Candidatus Omnitrophica bacterium]|nr:hypothetical protein [Candidatus Omnitrophota bacterium]
MKSGRTKRIIAYLILPFLIISLCPSRAETRKQDPAEYPVFHKGMCYTTWNKDSFGNKNSDDSLRSMADVGANCVAIVVTWYQDDFNSDAIKPTDRTPSDKSLRHAIRQAHKLGMAVMLKPHVDLENQQDSWRADIGFQSDDQWEKWFANYAKYVARYAQLAEAEGVEFFCVGTELTFAATKTDLWKNKVIPAVRKAFSGKITYAANWDSYNAVQFWDSLDYAGIDAYFSLSKKPDPTFEDIKEGWKKWVGEIEAWQATIKKPVLFTESGYCSSDTAAYNPWEEAVSGPPNLTLQADCYRALFETFWDKPWFAGVYWWNWTTVANGNGSNRRFSPQNKPALEYVKQWYTSPIDRIPAVEEKIYAAVPAEAELSGLPSPAPVIPATFTGVGNAPSLNMVQPPLRTAESDRKD